MVLADTILLPTPVLCIRGMLSSWHRAGKGLTSSQKSALEGRLFSKGHLEFQNNSENFETFIIIIPRGKKLPLTNANAL